eukprot:m.28891 g.28891  ORF g.28891 m.28891 type:complete len:50 (+) comp6100_c0_seq2:1142-1291(+)
MGGQHATKHINLQQSQHPTPACSSSKSAPSIIIFVELRMTTTLHFINNN